MVFIFCNRSRDNVILYCHGVRGTNPPASDLVVTFGPPFSVPHFVIVPFSPSPRYKFRPQEDSPYFKVHEEDFTDQEELSIELVSLPAGTHSIVPRNIDPENPRINED